MAQRYTDIENIRYDPFANSGNGAFTPNIIGHGVSTAERRTVPNSAPYVLYLYEAPQQNLPSTTEITLVVGGTTLFEKTRFETPGALEYSIVYYNELGTGAVKFNAAQAGAEVDINYYGLGHLTQTETFDTLTPINSADTVLRVEHDTSSEEDVYVIGASGGASDNTVNIGGGSASYNTATLVKINTAANTTTTTGTEVIRIDKDQKIATGGEPAPDCDAYGITHLMNVSDNIFCTVKNPNVAHGMTTIAETDTAFVQDLFGSSGGYIQTCLSENELSKRDNCYATGELTSTGTGATANYTINCSIKSGTSVTSHGNTGNMISIRNNNGTRLLLKGNGDLWINGDLSINGAADLKLIRITGVSAPPTDAELDSGFGTPATVGAGFIGFADEYLVYSDGSNWRHLIGTIAV